ncbi:hypothetical protein [Schlesneria paludicola]|uniref:hypothetical protein n=1 Tax=Schlesneria paludicola TaxID=360056 RepID=UPI00029AB408|nr:hypothetical protein [Schlesneria paludicola]
MKSEERHQLLTNDLGVVTNKTASFLERHLGTAIAVLCAALVFGAIGFWWTRSSEVDNAAAWKELDEASTLDDFGKVVDRFKGKLPAQWAQLVYAEKTLQSALPLMFTNRELAVTDLKSARGDFEKLLHEKSVPAAIRERALWGVAQCVEATCDGDTSKPIEAYDQLLKDYPETMFKVVADERLAALKRKDAAEFYTWFSKENPKPPEVRPFDIKPDGAKTPAADEKKDAAPAAPADPKANEPKAEEKNTELPKLDDSKPAESEKLAEPAKPAEGDQPKPAEPPKDGEKSPEKN